MAITKKIATCDYCDTRMVFTMSPDTRTDLKCVACGAPIRQSEFVESAPSIAPIAPLRRFPEAPLQRESEPMRKSDKRMSDKRNARSKKHHDDDDDRDDRSRGKSRRDKQRKKKRRGLVYWVRKIIDEVEDIID